MIDKNTLPPLPEDLIAPTMTASEVRNLLQRYGERCAESAIAAVSGRRTKPVAFAKDGVLFWHGDHTTWRGFEGDLYLAPQPAGPAVKESGENFNSDDTKLKPLNNAPPIAWATHHEPPMLFPTEAEAAAYCDDDEEPIPLYAKEQ